MTSKEVAFLIADLADAGRADNITVLNMAEVTLVADYFIVCSADTPIQTRAISDRILKTMKERGMRPLSVEGYKQGTWVLLDYGDVVVHVFRSEERSFYSLERLWADAEEVKRWAG